MSGEGGRNEGTSRTKFAIELSGNVNFYPQNVCHCSCTLPLVRVLRVLRDIFYGHVVQIVCGSF